MCIGSPETLEEQLSTFGQVLSSSALPSRSVALGGNLKQAHVGRPAFVSVATRDWRGAPVEGPEVQHFFCEAVPIKLAPAANRGPIELTTELTDMEDGSYELTFTLPVRGVYELAVKLFDTHIQGSPFKVTATPPPPEPAR